MTALPWLAPDLVLLVTRLDPVPADTEVTPGPWMAVLVLGLVVASTLLWFSMRRHLRRIRVPGDDAGPAQGDGSGADRARHNDRPADPPVS